MIGCPLTSAAAATNTVAYLAEVDTEDSVNICALVSE